MSFPWESRWRPGWRGRRSEAASQDGSHAAGRTSAAQRALVACLCGLSLPLTVCALRQARALLQSAPGELIGPLRTTLVSLACVSVFCLLCGSLFALAAQLMRRECALSPRLAGTYAYLLETAGAACGGVLTGIVLLRMLGSLQITMVNAALCLSAGFCLLCRRRACRAAVLAGAAILMVPLLVSLAPRMDRLTLQRLWPGFDILASRDSIYGRLTVIGAAGMRSVFDNGSILANVPDPAAAEESVHYALLEHPAPRNVLLIGGGMNGSIGEALKHPTLARLDYVELDPALIALYRQLFPRESALSFSDPRVQVHQTDGRAYLEGSRQRFDVVIVSAPDPANAQLNRFYTLEFFQSVKEHLAPGGLLALQLRSSEDIISPEQAAFLRCIGHTLRQVFPRIAVIPGESVHFFAAGQGSSLTEDPQVLISRLRERNLHTLYVREYFLPFRMMPDRMSQMHALLESSSGAPVNRDFHPAAYYFSTVLWSAQFDRTYAALLTNAERVPLAKLAAIVIASLFVLVLILRSGIFSQRRTAVFALCSVAATGYILMTLQILLLLTFQAVFGYLFQALALLIGMFMAGIAAGSMLGIRAGPSRCIPMAAMNQLVLAASAPLLLVLVQIAAAILRTHSGSSIAEIVFAAFALLCGIPGGFQFAIVSAIYLDEHKVDSSLATLYAVDLVGGCAGALALSGVLIPVFGFWNVAWLAALAGLAPAALQWRQRLPAS